VKHFPQENGATKEVFAAEVAASYWAHMIAKERK
jgi:hypothetical protein